MFFRKTITKWADKPLKIATLIILSLMVFSCGKDGPPEVACTLEARLGLSVVVLNSQSGARICDATVTATDGSYSETLTNHFGNTANCTYSGASERAGSYSITAEKTGFAEQTQDNIVVLEGECHITPAEQVTLSLDLA